MDTGVTVNVMDKCTFQRVTGCQGHTESISGVLHAFQTDESPMVPLKVIEKFDVMVESGKRMALATFHVLKGCTNTELLIGLQTAKDLGLVLVANLVQSNETAISKLVREYADLQEYWKDESGASGFARRPCNTGRGTGSQKDTF